MQTLMPTYHGELMPQPFACLVPDGANADVRVQHHEPIAAARPERT